MSGAAGEHLYVCPSGAQLTRKPCSTAQKRGETPVNLGPALIIFYWCLVMLRANTIQLLPLRHNYQAIVTSSPWGEKKSNSTMCSLRSGTSCAADCYWSMSWDSGTSAGSGWNDLAQWLQFFIFIKKLFCSYRFHLAKPTFLHHRQSSPYLECFSVLFDLEMLNPVNIREYETRLSKRIIKHWCKGLETTETLLDFRAPIFYTFPRFYVFICDHYLFFISLSVLAVVGFELKLQDPLTTLMNILFNSFCCVLRNKPSQSRFTSQQLSSPIKGRVFLKATQNSSKLDGGTRWHQSYSPGPGGQF